MSFHMFRASALAAAGIVALSAAASAQMLHHHHAPKSAITITLDGTLGPVISGDDPAGLDGQSATVTIKASESLKPFTTKGKSASYHLPKGAITVNVDGTDYSSTGKSTMTIALGKTADTLTLQGAIDIEGFNVNVTDVSTLAAGSWTKAALKHPTLFSPTPQDLTEPSSNFTYDVFGDDTELGVTGSISSHGGKLRRN